MDWSVFLPALAANLVGQAITGAAFLISLKAYRHGKSRWQEAQDHEGANDIFPI